MENLRLLAFRDHKGIKSVSLPRGLDYLPENLRYFSWDGYPLKSLPSTFSPEMLVQLSLKESRVEKLWDGEMFIPFFVVWNCESLETVLSSMGKSYLKPNPRTVSLLNCKKLEPHSYHTVLKDAIAGIELEARLNSGNEEDNTIQYLLPAAMPGREYWSHYSSTQVSFTLELPPNLLGFSYYLVLSQGHVGYLVDFGCDCHLDNISGQRIYIRSFPRVNIFTFGLFFNDDENSIRIKSDHVILWYDPISCKQIMEEIKAINHVNGTGYNPKLTFTFFVNETLHDQVTIKECGFRWIYHEETVSSTIFKSHDEDEETVPPTRKLQQRVFGTPVPSLELVETKGLRYLLE
ncbi:hypothetical protein TSUD_357530 [Trifolium subterraneum]|uniref:Uncharacterized protein n=1 Tax=Trifolium subterraneum TaxID=3900 RepID=A0A2Z6NGI8_TRISU|nr:hypothetical protein TSUD_357530 [Trifolium subterraneum]